MSKFDPEALKAAAESAARKSEMGSNITDQLAPHGSIVVEPEPTESEPSPAGDLGDLTTDYMGLTLRNPVVASAGPICQTLDGIVSLADAGVGAVVMYSLFEEQIRHEEQRALEQLERAQESFAEALDFFPTIPANNSGLSGTYLDLLEKAARRIDVPLIASMNGVTQGEWTKTAHRMQEAGASAIELNIYYVAGDLNTDARDVEQRHLDILADVKSQVSIPVAVKLSPYFSSVGALTRSLSQAGADGLVLFNRYLQPDIDLQKLEVTSGFELSTPSEGKLARSWIAALYGRVDASLAATTGVEGVEDIVKYLLSGADVVMTTSALIRHGASYASVLVDGLASWLQRKGLSLAQLRGMLAVPAQADANLYAREGYISGLERAKATYRMA